MIHHCFRAGLYFNVNCHFFGVVFVYSNTNVTHLAFYCNPSWHPSGSDKVTLIDPTLHTPPWNPIHLAHIITHPIRQVMILLSVLAELRQKLPCRWMLTYQQRKDNWTLWIVFGRWEKFSISKSEPHTNSMEIHWWEMDPVIKCNPGGDDRRPCQHTRHRHSPSLSLSGSPSRQGCAA